MTTLTKSRFGRSVIHLMVVLYCVNHFINPHLVWHIQGIIREMKGV